MIRPTSTARSRAIARTGSGASASTTEIVAPAAAPASSGRSKSPRSRAGGRATSRTSTPELDAHDPEAEQALGIAEVAGALQLSGREVVAASTGAGSSNSSRGRSSRTAASATTTAAMMAAGRRRRAGIQPTRVACAAVRIAVLSDVHGNRQAFEAVLDDVAGESVDELWCLGDLVGYGADPDACVSWPASTPHVCLVGNHDLAVRGDISLDDFSRGAALAAQWTKDEMDPDNLDFLRGLQPRGSTGTSGSSTPPRATRSGSTCSPRCSPSSAWTSSSTASASSATPTSRSRSAGEGSMATGETRRGGIELDLAAGRVAGQPRQRRPAARRRPRAAWLLLDTEPWNATFRRTEYDIAGAASAIRAARLPESLAERLEYGQ